MGMYDSVRIRCQNCKRVNADVQSKAGACQLKVYDLRDAPLCIVADLEEASAKGRIRCEFCSALIGIKVAWTVSVYEPESEVVPDPESNDGEYGRSA